MTDILRIDGTNRRPPSSEPDAYGQAALMLAESILHALVDTNILTLENAVAIVHTAQEVKEEVGREAHEKADAIEKSLRLLGSIATSLEADLN